MKRDMNVLRTVLLQIEAGGFEFRYETPREVREHAVLAAEGGLAEGGPGALEDVDGLAEGLRDLGGAGFGREVGRFGGDGDFEVHIRRPFPFSSGYI